MMNTLIKLFSILLFGNALLAMTCGATAGETIKFKTHHNNVGTKWDSSEMGDEPGHIRATFEAKGIGIRYSGPSEEPYKVDVWGSGEYWKDGTGSDRGYGKFTFSDGSYFYEDWVGKVANGRDVGTARYYGGSGHARGAPTRGAPAPRHHAFPSRRIAAGQKRTRTCAIAVGRSPAVV